MTQTNSDTARTIQIDTSKLLGIAKSGSKVGAKGMVGGKPT